MAKQKVKDVKEEIKKQEEEVYGDETESGSNPDPEQVQEETTRELVEDVTGDKPQVGKAYNIGDEVNEDEEDLHEK